MDSKGKKVEPTELERQEAASLKKLYDSKKRTLKLTQEAIADTLQITQGGVSHYLNGRNPLNLKVASVIARLLQVDISEFSERLADEQKQMQAFLRFADTVEYIKPSERNVLEISEPTIAFIPLISWVQAGQWCESPDPYQPGDAEDWMPAPPNAGPRTFALGVVNDSMTSPYPGQRSYPHGCIIYIDPDRQATNGARVVARVGGEYTFKAYVEDAGRKYLKPINPTYDKIEITEDVHICGVVIGSYMPE
ncbi:hypothetical protein PHACT_12695 [Pseudohongiella acticola]|uniref:HTH cro/C1-type domain-containing protein n=1 Tax=Pseudohongiella acticola TaxID=1524254 RepID=A0A1E8CGE6_9GAMM|nr:LexA family transcriptional regulator [Pseudohongiella acticola]OFE11409.1 hypothetical protein PHACT_12695 [Pseudohongiella acticola]